MYQIDYVTTVLAMLVSEALSQAPTYAVRDFVLKTIKKKNFKCMLPYIKKYFASRKGDS